jgi:hypothetical protein
MERRQLPLRHRKRERVVRVSLTRFDVDDVVEFVTWNLLYLEGHLLGGGKENQAIDLESCDIQYNRIPAIFNITGFQRYLIS